MVITKREFIAKLYYCMAVEIGNSLDWSDMRTVLDCDLTIEEFEAWLDDQSNRGIEKVDERAIFHKWLEEYELSDIWNEESELQRDSSEIRKARIGEYHPEETSDKMFKEAGLEGLK